MLTYIYMVLTIVMGGAAIFKGAVYPGIAGIVGPALCLFAASGTRGSLLVGTRSQKISGLATGAVFALVGFGLVYHSGYWVGIFGYELAGVTWCATGAVVGYISTTKRFAIESMLPRKVKP
jgi:hypothetical protein